RAGDLECNPVGDSGVGGPLAGQFDGPVVVVGADDPRGRVVLGEQDRGGAKAAADVRDDRPGPQLAVHAVKRGNPGGNEVGDVAGAEELRAAGKDALVVLVPA